MTGFTPTYDDDPIAFEITRDPEEAPLCLHLAGEMDLRAATDLREALLKALADGNGSVLLDLGELSFIDSTIISVLIMARKRADSEHGEVRLRNVPGRIQRILAITGIDTLFPTEGARTVGAASGDPGGGSAGDC